MNNFTEEAWAAFQEAALDKYDFGTCQRPDGSYYGSPGRCVKGSDATLPDKSKGGSSKSGGGGGGSESSNALGKVKIMSPDSVKKASDETLKAQFSNANKAGFGKGANNSPEVMKGLKEQHDLASAELDRRNKSSGGGGGDVKSLKAEVKRLDKDARAKDKAADKASADWKKGGAKTGTAEHKRVKELDKAAKEANKKADAADKKYQAAAKKAQGGTKLDKASRNEYAKQAKREQQAIKDLKDEMKRNGKTPELEKKLRQAEMRAGKFDKFAKTGVFTK